MDRNDEVRLDVFRGSVGELVRSEWGSCSMRSWLCTGCQDPVEVCYGSLLLSIVVVFVAIRILVVVALKTSERGSLQCLVVSTLLRVALPVSEGILRHLTHPLPTS